MLVVSDRTEAGALERARQANIAAVHAPRTTRAVEFSELLSNHLIDVIALAGYLRLVPAPVVRAFRGRIVNVHPALLPDYGGPGMYGRRVHEAVLAAGDSESGATVHFVDELYDRGAIIAQARVRVNRNDTPDTLGERVLKAEHHLYPRVLAALCAGTVHLNPDGTASGWPPATNP